MKKKQPTKRLLEVASLSALRHGMHLVVVKDDRKYAEGILQGYPWSSKGTQQAGVAADSQVSPNDSLRLALVRSSATKDIQVDGRIKIFRVVTV